MWLTWAICTCTLHLHCIFLEEQIWGYISLGFNPICHGEIYIMFMLIHCTVLFIMSIKFYSILFYSILFYSILFYSCLFIWACEGLSIPKALHIDVWEMAAVTAVAAGCEQTQSAHARDVSLGARIYSPQAEVGFGALYISRAFAHASLRIFQ